MVDGTSDANIGLRTGLAFDVLDLDSEADLRGPNWHYCASCIRMLMHHLAAPTAPVFDELMRGSMNCDLICAGCSNADVALVLGPNRPRRCLQHPREAACGRPGPGDRRGAGGRPRT